ncbi:type IX secretion system sortase PorU [Flammeovirga aprica]|uniref:Type IX secretion system sortase PorU n=1 Tax=Flammeovirga aprica JL-4 TaxID=694437 RepID=A0A7X9NZ29_9BACT|nr:type IX secretion system sortase PorU [Flammeovirga aprica]NME66430.1 type IX secretion system sortase PorU [Flammeovirga aprica JL-4]
MTFSSFIKYISAYFLLIIFTNVLTTSVFAQSGPLSTGQIFKLKIDKNGVYKIDKSLLDELGVSTSGLNTNNIAVFGFGNGMLPQENAQERPSSLTEVPLLFVGGNAESFQDSDYFLFYAEGADKVYYNSENQFIDYELNLYDVANYYFLRVGVPRTKNIGTENASIQNPDVFTSLIQVYHHESEEVTALSEPSGRFWFGENLSSTNTATVNINVNPSTNALRLKAGVMAKSRAESTFSYQVNGTDFGSFNVRSASDFNNYRYGRQGYMESNLFAEKSINISSSSLAVSVNFSKPQSDSEGYIDYLTFNAKSSVSKDKENLIYHGVFSENSDGGDLSTSLSFDYVWDITDPSNVKRISKQSNKYTVSKTKDYFSLLFFDAGDILKPSYVGTVPNQDLRSLPVPDLLLITSSAYSSYANSLASHRTAYSGIDVKVINVETVYNEFSSGRQDVSAVRDFARHLYLKDNKLKYILLFGQCSYDYKGIRQEGKSQVPIYESRDVLKRTTTFSSDDYFGFMDENEGFWGEEVDGKIDNYDMEVGVGRLPARTADEAEILVNKIIHYDTLKLNTTGWKKNILFVADDGDSNTHQGDANDLAVYVEETCPNFVSQRLFIDNQPKISTPSGARSPETNDLLSSWIDNDGVLIVNYSGHGSITHWAEESIFTPSMVSALKNPDQTPLFFTATCEFGRYDNPAIMSGAERLLFKETGGSIALMTTTRPVYASSNFTINEAFYKAVFKKDENNNYRALGEVFRETKNNSLRGVNNRNFALLSDPSMQLNIPNIEASITSINDEEFTGNYTLKALDKVKIGGEIKSGGVRDTSFNGDIFVTLFEKSTESETRGNNGAETIFKYNERKYQLFRGVADVVNGEYQIEFVIPKDIRYAFDAAKFHLYAVNNSNTEALGSNVEVMLGGTSDNPIVDTTPPVIDLSIYSEKNNNVVYPDTYITTQISDDFGLNISGIGAGHDVKLILNGEDSSWVLNDYLVPVKGEKATYSLVFPLKNLPEGENSLTLEAWDVANNRSEQTISFFVSPVSEITISNFTLFPNPAVNDVDIRFSHNLLGQDLEIKSNIISMNGNIVASNDFSIENSESEILLTYQGLKTNYNLVGGIYVVQLIIDCPALGIKTYQTARIVLK